MRVRLVYMYLEGNASQSECLEIPLGSLHSTQHETFLAGADVVLPVAVERTHTDGKREVKRGQDCMYPGCAFYTTRHVIRSPA